MKNRCISVSNLMLKILFFFDSSKGPIWIGDGVHIHAHSRLEGPLVIGDHCVILGAKLSHSLIGNGCKISGEVSHSIFLGWTNKAHEGFVGHSVVGQWVNLGAGTTVSNLKNTYGSIHITDGIHPVQTGRQFLGAIIGDHVKTGIGTRLNAGTVIGVGASMWGGALHPKWIPYFAFGEAKHYKKYEIEPFFKMVDAVYKRRQLTLEDTDKKMLQLLWDASHTYDDI